MSLSERRLLENRVVLRPDEIASILRCSIRTVYRLVDVRALEAVPAGRK
jgi:excisionase family DNA binding protein